MSVQWVRTLFIDALLRRRLTSCIVSNNGSQARKSQATPSSEVVSKLAFIMQS